MVDDAHGIGVLGPGGAGTAAHFGLADQVDLIMGTFSKSLAAIGGFIASTERVINYLKHHSRPFVFSASASPASVAAALAALDVMRDEPERLTRLWNNQRFMKEGLDRLGFDTGASETPDHSDRRRRSRALFRSVASAARRGDLHQPRRPARCPAGPLHDPDLRHGRSHAKAAQLGAEDS